MSTFRIFLKKTFKSITRIAGGERGITFVEVLITGALVAVLVLSVVPLFNVTSRGFTSLEVNTVLSSGSQAALNKIQHRLVESKRIFGNTASDNAFLAKVTFSGAPSVLSGSKLPVIVSTASISPSSATFNAANVGNSLFFASLDSTADFDDIAVSGGTQGIRIDTYVFNYYYLSPDSSQTIGGSAVRRLWEWHSVRYADYIQIVNITDTTKRTNTITALKNSGIDYAWCSSATVATSAFYTLTAGNANPGASSGHSIPKASGSNSQKNMLQLVRGVTTGGFRYSVSPNTSGSFNPKHTVPVYGMASGNFPSGFEVLVVGPSGTRQVFMRLVLAAQGSFKGFLSNDQTVLVTTRDVW